MKKRNLVLTMKKFGSAIITDSAGQEIIVGISRIRGKEVRVRFTASDDVNVKLVKEVTENFNK